MQTILAILLAASSLAVSEPLSAALQRRNTPYSVYAGGYASDYKPVYAPVSYLRYLPQPRPHSPARPLRQAYSHMRQQIYAASAPHVHYTRHPYPTAAPAVHHAPPAPTIRHPPPSVYSTTPSYAPAPTAYPQPAYMAPTAYSPAATYAQPSAYHGGAGYAYSAASAWPPTGPEIVYMTEAAEEEPVYITEASDAVVLGAAEVYDTVMYARPNERGGYNYRRRPSRRPPAPKPDPESYILKIKKRKIYLD